MFLEEVPPDVLPPLLPGVCVVVGGGVGGAWMYRHRCRRCLRGYVDGVGGGGRRGAVTFSFWAWLGLGPAMCEVVWVGVRGGEQFAWATLRGRGGWGWVFWDVCRGRGRATGWGGRAAGRGAPLGGCVWVVECGGW